MQEIADKAGINKALLHYYYRSKEKLYEQVFEEVFVNTFGELHRVFKDEVSFIKALKTFINEYIDLLKKNPHIPVFIMQELNEGAETAIKVLQKSVSDDKFKLPKAFLKSINKAIENNEIRRVNPFQFMLTMIGSCVYYFIAEPLFTEVFFAHYRSEKSTQFNRAEFIEHRKKAIFDLFYNGLKRPEN